MPATLEQKKEFQNESKRYKAILEGHAKEIAMMRKALKDKPEIKSYLLVGIAIEHLKVVGNNLAISDISQEILDLKNESYLNTARKEIYKILQAIEEIVGNEVDSTLTDNQDAMQALTLLTAGQRLNLLNATLKATDGMIARYGTNTKWRWSFQELYSRLAVAAKNLTDWRRVEGNRDPRHPEYQDLVKLGRFVRERLFQAAQEYKRKYELSDQKTQDDLKTIIRLFEALHRIHSFFGEAEEAERIKTLIEATKDTLETLLNPEKKKANKAAATAGRR